MIIQPVKAGKSNVLVYTEFNYKINYLDITSNAYSKKFVSRYAKKIMIFCSRPLRKDKSVDIMENFV